MCLVEWRMRLCLSTDLGHWCSGSILLMILCLWPSNTISLVQPLLLLPMKDEDLKLRWIHGRVEDSWAVCLLEFMRTWVFWGPYFGHHRVSGAQAWVLNITPGQRVTSQRWRPKSIEVFICTCREENKEIQFSTSQGIAWRKSMQISPCCDLTYSVRKVFWKTCSPSCLVLTYLMFTSNAL